jgi:hypothetical protein
MKWDDAARTFTIGARQGSFDGMKGKRTLFIRYHNGGGIPEHDTVVEYDGTETTIKF